MKLPNRKHVRLLVVILGLSLVLRLGVFLAIYSVDPSRVLGGDSASYDNPARALVEIGRFAVRPEASEVPETKRTPGYPAFIAASYLVFGERHWPVIAIQIVISIGTLGVTYAIAKMLWGSRTALIALLLLALDVASFHSSQKLLTDTLFAFLITVAVAAGIRLISGESARTGSALVLGIALALATLVRPIGYYLVFPVLVGFLVWGKVARWRWKRIAAVFLLIAVPSLVLVGGWQLRNYCVSGSAEFSHMRGHNLLWYRGAGIVALRDGISIDEAREKIEDWLPDVEGWTTAEQCDLYAREGMALIRRYPILFVKMQARETADLLLAPAQVLLVRYLTGTELKASPFGDAFRLAPREYASKWVIGKPALFAAFVYEMAYLAVLYGCALYALWRIVRSERERLACHLFVWGVILYFVIISAGPEAHSRFRIPFMPLLVMYAGMSLNRLWDRIKALRSKEAER